MGITPWLSIADEGEDERLRDSMRRGTPYGDDEWRKEVAKRNGLETTMRPRGRPKAA
jgi:putative transposase